MPATSSPCRTGVSGPKLLQVSRLLAWVLRLLPAVGIVFALVGAGAFGDLPDSWWDPKGFVVNLVSGATAGCIGVPIAVFVLQTILRDRESVADQRQLAATTHRIVLRLQSLVATRLALGLSTRDRVTATGDCFADIQGSMRRIVSDFDGQVEPPALSRVLSQGDKAGLQGDLADEVERAPILDDFLDIAQAMTDLLAEDINRRLMSEGWNPLPVQELLRVREFLDWRRNYFNPVTGPDPVPFEQVKEFKRRLWPQARRSLTVRIEEGETDTYMGLDERAMFEELLEAARQAKHDAFEVGHALEALDILASEAEHIRRREKA